MPDFFRAPWTTRLLPGLCLVLVAWFVQTGGCSSPSPTAPGGDAAVASAGRSPAGGQGGPTGGAGTTAGSGGRAETTGGGGAGGTAAGPTGGATGSGAAGTGGTASGGRGAGAASGANGGGTGVGGAGGNATGRTTFDIYWVDVEGGGATLLVSPSGQTMLVDGGFPDANDRDVNRVLKVINEQVHVTKLDYVVTTHFHGDHVGGITALASRFPVGQFMDHGPSVEGGALYNDYVAAIAGKTRVIVKPGDRLQLGALEVLFVASGGQLIDAPPTATANPFCAGAPQMAERPTDENPLSVGFVARFGTFDFLDLGDMTWAVENRFACPVNRVGPVDLLQVTHHGLGQSSAPQLVHALAPLVAVMNNGATKGGTPSTFDILKASPGLLDLWALHRAVNNDAAHNATEALIANLSTAPDGAYFVKAAVSPDGAFTVTNGRTGETRAYRSR